jgi:hypothetical protein
VGCKDPWCSFGERIGWWWVTKSPPIGLEFGERMRQWRVMVGDEVSVHWFRWKGCAVIAPCTRLEVMGWW